MSGLLAGLLLRRASWDVEIFERVETELASRGAGIVAQPELVTHLASLELDTRNLGVNAPTRKILESPKANPCVYQPKRKEFPVQITSGFRLIAPITDRFCRARQNQSL